MRIIYFGRIIMKQKIRSKKRPITKSNESFDIFIPSKLSFKYRLDSNNIVSYEKSPTFKKFNKHY